MPPGGPLHADLSSTRLAIPPRDSVTRSPAASDSRAPRCQERSVLLVQPQEVISHTRDDTGEDRPCRSKPNRTSCRLLFERAQPLQDPRESPGADQKVDLRRRLGTRDVAQRPSCPSGLVEIRIWPTRSGSAVQSSTGGGNMSTDMFCWKHSRSRVRGILIAC